MLRNIVLGAFIALFVQLQTATAAEDNKLASTSETEVTASEGQAVPHTDSQDNADYIHWDFITCVHSNHECYDEAMYHHFPHYKAVYDHHLCHGHAPLACYGGHH